MVLPRVIQCELRRNSAQRVAFCHPSLNGDLSRPTAEVLGSSPLAPTRKCQKSGAWRHRRNGTAVLREQQAWATGDRGEDGREAWALRVGEFNKLMSPRVV